MKRYGGAVAFPATAVSRRIKIHLLSGISTGEGPELIRNGSVCPACGAVSYEYFQFENAARLKPYDLSFRGKSAVFPPCFCQATLRRRLAMKTETVPLRGCFCCSRNRGTRGRGNSLEAPRCRMTRIKVFGGAEGEREGEEGPPFPKGGPSSPSPLSLSPDQLPTTAQNDRQPTRNEQWRQRRLRICGRLSNG